MTDSKTVLRDGNIKFRINIDEMDMDIMHNALFVYMAWLNDEALPAANTEVDVADEHGVDVSVPLRSAMYVTTKTLRARLVDLVGHDMTESNPILGLEDDDNGS